MEPVTPPSKTQNPQTSFSNSPLPAPKTLIAVPQPQNSTIPTNNPKSLNKSKSQRSDQLLSPSDPSLAKSKVFIIKPKPFSMVQAMHLLHPPIKNGERGKGRQAPRETLLRGNRKSRNNN